MLDDKVLPKKSYHWQINAIFISIIISMLLYIGFSLYVGWQGVISIFVKVGVIGLFITLALSLFNYILRFMRWQMYLNHLGYSVESWQSWKIYLSGFALTTTPGKTGEAVRSVFLKNFNVPITASLSAFISERLSDLVAIVLLSCIGLFQYPVARLPIFITLVIILFFWFIVMNPRVLSYFNNNSQGTSTKLSSLIQKIIHIIYEMQKCHTPSMLILTSLLAVLSWGAEAVALFLLVKWAGFDLDFGFTAFVYALSMLAGALSFLPGGLGGAEATMVSLFVLKGLDMKSAVAITIFIRFTTLWFAVILGIIAMLQLKSKKISNE